jgi:ribosomal protein S18 acetylase RimI-like enzyme
VGELSEPAAVRVATRQDVPALAASLARAFADDPIMTYLLGGDDLSRTRRITRFFTAALRVQHLRHELCFTDAQQVAGSLWDPPGQWRMSPGQIVAGARWLVPAFGTRVPRALRVLSTIEKVHPGEPHYYLAVLGTAPERQGQGLGSAVMQPVLDRCDDEGVPAYLESSKESNIPFYRRHGFAVTGEIHLPGGPSLWPMWRDPAR